MNQNEKINGRCIRKCERRMKEDNIGIKTVGWAHSLGHVGRVLPAQRQEVLRALDRFGDFAQ
jgi:hypothetical protein